jgi:hypothetical protein
MDANSVLTSIARDLLSESRSYVPLVMADGAAAVPHPFGSLIAAQGASSADAFHLPEPLLHPVPRPDVVAIGLNPGYNAGEAMPTPTWPLADYVGWYATRFDDLGRTRTGWPASTRDDTPDKGGRSHYAEVERMLLAAGLGPRPLGRRACYADAIPWKADVPPDFRDGAIAGMASERLRRIAEGLEPRVLLALSPTVGDLLGAAHPRQPAAVPVTLGNWQGFVVASYHPNHRFRGEGSKRAYHAAIGSAIADALDVVPS